MQVIGGLTILITFYYIFRNFFLILNDQVTWWFLVVTIVLLIPLYIDSGLFFNWFIKDSLSRSSLSYDIFSKFDYSKSPRLEVLLRQPVLLDLQRAVRLVERVGVEQRSVTIWVNNRQFCNKVTFFNQIW